MNEIRELPAAVGSLVHLQQLSLSHNKLSVLPPELCALRSLTALDLSHNRIVPYVPVAAFFRSKKAREDTSLHMLAPLESLRSLCLANNQITSLPPCTHPSVVSLKLSRTLVYSPVFTCFVVSFSPDNSRPLLRLSFSPPL
jgi:Leucine-rich repeat (LRR) protein